MSESPSNAKSAYPATEEKIPWPICLVGARSKHHQRIFSSLGPLIHLTGGRDPYSFTLLYCAHTANTLRGKSFYFSRLHHADGLIAKKFHSFSENEFNDLAIAHTSLTEEYCQSHLIKTKIKQVSAINIGDEVRILSGTSPLKTNCIISISQEQNVPSKTPSLFKDLIQLDAQSIPGESGSPVLSMSNELIGLITRTDEYGNSYCNNLHKAIQVINSHYKNSKMKPDLKEIYFITE